MEANLLYELFNSLLFEKNFLENKQYPSKEDYEFYQNRLIHIVTNIIEKCKKNFNFNNLLVRDLFLISKNKNVLENKVYFINDYYYIFYDKVFNLLFNTIDRKKILNNNKSIEKYEDYGFYTFKTLTDLVNSLEPDEPVDTKPKYSLFNILYHDSLSE